MTNPRSVFEEALALIDECDCVVLPVTFKEKADGKFEKRGDYNWSTLTKETSRARFEAMRAADRAALAGIGILCGKPSNCLVVDLDRAKDPNEIDGVEWFEQLQRDNEPIHTLTATTQSGGRHLYFQYDERFCKSHIKFVKYDDRPVAVDLLSDGKFVVAPPSVLPNGNKYIYDDPDVPLARIPEWLAAFIPQRGNPSVNIALPQGDDVFEDAAAPVRPTTKLDEYKLLLQLISPDCPYDEWVKVGMALKSECKKDDKIVYFKLFDEWSSASKNKYNAIECAKKWEQLDPRKDGIKIGTLYHIAKESNPAEFVKIVGSDDKHSLKSYAEMKEAYERDHFKIHKDALYGWERPDGLCLYKAAQLREMDGNLWCLSGGQKAKFINKWIEDPQIRTFDKVDFAPQLALNNNNNNNCYNLYRGLVSEAAPGFDDERVDITSVLDHIKSLVGDDDSNYNYFMKWLAQIVQTPGKMNTVAVVIRSEQGVGKSMFADWFGNKVLGANYYYCTSDISDLVGKFAVGMKHKLFVNMNETSGTDTFNVSERLKHLITAPVIKLEKKGIDAIEIHNYARFLFFTNNSTPVKIEQGDRRFVVFESVNKNLRNSNYFNMLSKEMDRPEVAHSFLRHLRDIDLSGFNFEVERPLTAAYRDIQQVNVPVIVHFIDDYLMKNPDVTSVTNGALFEAYGRFLTAGNFNIQGKTIKSFARDIKKIEGITQERTATARGYKIDAKAVRKFIEKQIFDE